MSGMRGAISHSPNTPSWRGAQLKHRDDFTFSLYRSIEGFRFKTESKERIRQSKLIRELFEIF
jgi:hypothetical protein